MFFICVSKNNCPIVVLFCLMLQEIYPKVSVLRAREARLSMSRVRPLYQCGIFYTMSDSDVIVRDLLLAFSLTETAYCG